MQSVHDFFNVHNHFFETNNVGAMARHFLLPSAVYVGDAIMVFEKADDVIEIYTNFRKSLNQEGYTRSTARTVAQSLPHRPHISAWVEWKHFGAGDDPISTSTSRYFFERQSDKTLRVQLVEYIQLPAERFLQAWPLDNAVEAEAQVESA